MQLQMQLEAPLELRNRLGVDRAGMFVQWLDRVAPRLDPGRCLACSKAARERGEGLVALGCPSCGEL